MLSLRPGEDRHRRAGRRCCLRARRTGCASSKMCASSKARCRALLEEGTTRPGRRYLVISMRRAARRDPRLHRRPRALPRQPGQGALSRRRLRGFRHGPVAAAARSAGRGLRSRRQMRTLEDAYDDCETALLYWTGPYVLSQGDFAPWNIRNLGSQLFVFDWGDAARRREPARRRAALPDDPARAERAPVTRRAARGDERARRVRAAAYPEWSWRAAGDRRADARLPARRGAAPLARRGPLRPRRPRGRPLLEAAGKTLGLDAVQHEGEKEP